MFIDSNVYSKRPHEFINIHLKDTSLLGYQYDLNFITTITVDYGKQFIIVGLSYNLNCFMFNKLLEKLNI